MPGRCRFALVAFSTLCLGCGSSPTAPVPISLQPGNYLLTLAVAPPAFCLGPTPAIDRASVPVFIAAAEEGVSIRPTEQCDLGLRGTLRVDSIRGIVQGRIEGAAGDVGGEVSVTVTPITLDLPGGAPFVMDPVFTGTLTTDGVSGFPLKAELHFQQAGETRRCVGGAWGLTPR